MDKVRLEITSPLDYDNIFYGLADKYKGQTLSVFNIGTKKLPYMDDHCAVYRYKLRDIISSKMMEHDLMRLKSSLPIIVIADYQDYELIKDKLPVGNHHWQLFLRNDKPLSMHLVSTIVNTDEESAVYFDHSLVDIVDRNKYPILTDYQHYDLVAPHAKKLVELDNLLRTTKSLEDRQLIKDEIKECRFRIKDNLYV